MIKKFFPGVLFFIFFSPLSGMTQNYVVKESATLVPDFLHAFFRIDPEHYLALNYSGPHGAFSSKRDDMSTVATLYDKNLRQVYSGLITELGGKRYEAAIESSGGIQVFFSDPHQTVYKSQFDLSKKELTGAGEELFTIPNETAEFTSGFSSDSAYCYLLCKSYEKKGKDMAYNGVILDKDMKIVSKFSFVLDGLKEYISSSSCALSGSGRLYVVTGVRVKSEKNDYRPIQYLLTDINGDEKPVIRQLNDLPEGLLDGLVWTAQKDILSFMGLLSKDKKSGFESIVSGNYDATKNKVSINKEIDLKSSPYFQNASAKYIKDLAKEGIPTDIHLIGKYELSDHSEVLVFEKREIILSARGDFSYTDTNTGNIYLVKIDSKGELDWVQMIPNRTQEPSFPSYTGLIAFPDVAGGIILFFHDNTRNEKAEGGDRTAAGILGGDWRLTSLAAVHIDAKGNPNKKYIIDDYKADLLLAPEKPFTIYKDEIIYTSYNLKNLGKSTYRIGRIKIY